jgi:hypothetical protein
MIGKIYQRNNSDKEQSYHMTGRIMNEAPGRNGDRL